MLESNSLGIHGCKCARVCVFACVCASVRGFKPGAVAWRRQVSLRQQ